MVLPAPFGPISPTRSPRMMRAEHRVENGAVAEALGHVLELGDELARALAGIEAELDVAEALAPRGALLAQVLEPLHAAFVARAARLDALADPHFFLRPELVEAAVRDFFGGELVALARFVGGEVAGIGAQHAAIELDDARGHAVEERAVVRDDDARRHFQQQLFEPLDAVDVEMVGRLVEQQQLGLEREASASAARLRSPPESCSRRALGIEIEAMQEFVQARAAIASGRGRRCRCSAGMHAARRRQRQQAFAQRGRRGQLAAPAPRTRCAGRRALQLAVVELQRARDHPQQRGLAGAVAADEADALAGLQREPCTVEQRLVAVGEMGIEKCDEGHAGHCRGWTRAAQSLYSPPRLNQRCAVSALSARRQALPGRLRFRLNHPSL